MKDFSDQTLKACREQIAALSLDAFKDHVLTKVADERWRCARQDGTWTYGFFVVIAPGTVIVYGDIEDGIFRHSDQNGLEWVKRNVRDPSYVLSKLQHRRKAFYVGDAVVWAQAQHDEIGTPESKEFLDAVSHAAECGELNDHTFYEAIREHNFEPDGDMATGDDPSNFWIMGALRTFVRLLDQEHAC